MEIRNMLWIVYIVQTVKQCKLLAHPSVNPCSNLVELYQIFPFLKDYIKNKNIYSLQNELKHPKCNTFWVELNQLKTERPKTPKREPIYVRKHVIGQVYTETLNQQSTENRLICWTRLGKYSQLMKIWTGDDESPSIQSSTIYQNSLYFH